MGLFSKCMFSEVEGVVLFNGTPMEGVKVVKSYRWGNTKETKEYQSVTDSDGRFRFDASFSNSFTFSIFPHEPVLIQYLVFNYKDKEYLGWRHYKGDYIESGETGFSPIKLECDLSWEEEEHEIQENHKDYIGICKIQEDERYC
ncbi:hypothetical protein KJY73_09920 [Bowmanella sp. Y26]|uniref:DUF4198 domain-containing protein n=1 Tax=Bowmanella yangjiangensis TaxID=2811230 RepID=UPI001BDC9E2B|nr:DUF4198 domain-containing protein [Bowmanella yangjiangensis]MBT1063890.1 hypothetical protein [Bowmanella yangjiangensis]